MEYRQYIKLGVNHHLLFVDHASDPPAHERTLKILLGDERFEVVDMWVPDVEPYGRNVINAVRQSGKSISYNIGTRRGKEPAHPATLDAVKRSYSLRFYRDELDRAIEAGAEKRGRTRQEL